MKCSKCCERQGAQRHLPGWAACTQKCSKRALLFASHPTHFFQRRSGNANLATFMRRRRGLCHRSPRVYLYPTLDREGTPADRQAGRKAANKGRDCSCGDVAFASCPSQLAAHAPGRARASGGQPSGPVTSRSFCTVYVPRVWQREVCNADRVTTTDMSLSNPDFTPHAFSPASFPSRRRELIPYCNAKCVEHTQHCQLASILWSALGAHSCGTSTRTPIPRPVMHDGNGRWFQSLPLQILKCLKSSTILSTRLFLRWSHSSVASRIDPPAALLDKACCLSRP